MKKFIFGIVVIIIVGIVIVSLPKQGKEEDKQVADAGAEPLEGDDGFYIGTLSDKDIYAINDFCFLVTYDNIIRYSEFMFGNSAPLEHMMLFPEILEDGDEVDDFDI